MGQHRKKYRPARHTRWLFYRNGKLQMNKEESQKRRLFKQNARKVLKHHYFMLMMLCLVAIYFGAEFRYVTSQTNDTYNILTGRVIEDTEFALRINDNTILEKALDKIGIDTTAMKESRLAEEREEIRKSGSQDLRRIKGGSRGFLSRVVKYYASGDIIDTLIDAGVSVFHSETIAMAILIIAGLLVTLFIWAFLKNVYIAILRRMFLEARAYRTVPFSHVLFFRAVDKWKKASLSMVRLSVYKLLWWITVIGGVIKHYSYMLVPYIIAENPDIDGKEAIRLSQRMMDGRKMEAFWIDCSFIGWHILGYLSFGLAEALWVVPYKTAVFAELYADARKEAKACAIEGCENLNDEYLFTGASEDMLKNAYADIEEHKRFVETHWIDLAPVNAFFAENFSIWLGSSSEKQRYDEVDSIRKQIEENSKVISGEIYPLRLNPLWKNTSVEVVHSARYLRTYTILSIIMIFFVFSFVGWSWEVCLHLVKDGVFVNRGVMHGPWLPVYGSGVSLIVVLLARWRGTPYKEAFLTLLLCGFLEYMTSYWLEMTKGMRWWDYTGYILNLNGRICAEGLIVFVVGGMAAVYVLVPLIDSALSRVNTKTLSIVCMVLVISFAADMVYSHYVPNTGEGITDYEAYKKSSEYYPDITETELSVFYILSSVYNGNMDSIE